MGRITVAVVVSLWVIPISIIVNKIVPDPYVDEIFHIPQAQKYRRGDFKTWDPMITTLPGLYYLSLAYVASLFPGLWFASAVQSLHELCSPAYLRSTNAFLATICSILVYDLLIYLRPSIDVASITAVLAMYLASVKRQYWVSALGSVPQPPAERDSLSWRNVAEFQPQI